MSFSGNLSKATAALTMAAISVVPVVAAGRDDPAKKPESTAQKSAAPVASNEKLKSINDDYDQALVQLERRRLERLGRLAAEQTPAAAVVTYEQLFRLAIAGNLFLDAEPAAKTVITIGSPSPIVTGLARLVQIIALADRGDYEQAIENLRQALVERDKAARNGGERALLPTSDIVAICDAYYQRLIQGAQYENVRKALQILLGHTERQAVKEYLSSRLKRVDMVGKPAPPIEGPDIDKKAYRLADSSGKVVLVVFWASWCLPCSAEVEWLQQVEKSYQTRGLQIVGINLDSIQDDGQKLETVMPNIRHFLLDHNVGWPTLINGQGDKDYAKAYGVSEIPANVLIARDGTITHIDLVHKNLEPAIAKAIGP
jgi:thiol-disulfide isomerase/thioredoxin